MSTKCKKKVLHNYYFIRNY